MQSAEVEECRTKVLGVQRASVRTRSRDHAVEDTRADSCKRRGRRVGRTGGGGGVLGCDSDGERGESEEHFGEHFDITLGRS